VQTHAGRKRKRREEQNLLVSRLDMALPDEARQKNFKVHALKCDSSNCVDSFHSGISGSLGAEGGTQNGTCPQKLCCNYFIMKIIYHNIFGFATRHLLCRDTNGSTRARTHAQTRACTHTFTRSHTTFTCSISLYVCSLSAGRAAHAVHSYCAHALSQNQIHMCLCLSNICNHINMYN